ncbi:MAG: monofunctional biosynthetic peptidoglycan transglycosylase, partial [Rhodospirillales bacterium]|nr:monofunctional biosynthetic peptidoglycan transglycosylase [Rhodospirillales bacterium]
MKAKLKRLALWVTLLAIALPLTVIVAYRFFAPPITPLMIIRLAEGEGWDYRWVPLTDISPHLVRAVMAAEDARFCEHFGFDFNALSYELDEWLEGERPRGASTISQQTAKNILLWPGRGLLRKGLEAWLTPQVELVWSKHRIFEVYLNVIEVAPGIYGAEAGAQRLFGTSAARLSPGEAARLAAVLPNPRGRSAVQPSQRVQGRANLIERRARAMDGLDRLCRGLIVRQPS